MYAQPLHTIQLILFLQNKIIRQYCLWIMLRAMVVGIQFNSREQSIIGVFYSVLRTIEKCSFLWRHYYLFMSLFFDHYFILRVVILNPFKAKQNLNKIVHSFLILRRREHYKTQSIIVNLNSKKFNVLYIMMTWYN